MGETRGDSNVNGGGNNGGFWDFMSDVIGAAGDVVKTVAGKREVGGAPTYVQKSGIDPQILRYAVIALIGLIIWKMFKG